MREGQRGPAGPLCSSRGPARRGRSASQRARTAGDGHGHTAGSRTGPRGTQAATQSCGEPGPQSSVGRRRIRTRGVCQGKCWGLGSDTSEPRKGACDFRGAEQDPWVGGLSPRVFRLPLHSVPAVPFSPTSVPSHGASEPVAASARPPSQHLVCDNRLRRTWGQTATAPVCGLVRPGPGQLQAEPWIPSEPDVPSGVGGFGGASRRATLSSSTILTPRSHNVQRR